MTNELHTTLSDEPEKELDAIVHDTTPRERSATLTRLLVAFDARRRRREAIAITETAEQAMRAARTAS